MLILRGLTHISLRCAYKSALPAASLSVFISTKKYSKMSTSGPAANGDSPYKPRFVDVGFITSMP